MVVPHRALYYVPFHALYDGVSYLIERREVASVPSASVLRHCMARPRRPLDRALLMGVSDEQAPRVRDELPPELRGLRRLERPDDRGLGRSSPAGRRCNRGRDETRRDRGS